MRQRLDSINILDKSTTAPGVSNLESNLDRTLDKFRRVESKLTSGKQTPADAKIATLNLSPQKEKELPSFSKLLEVLREKKSATNSPYKGKITPRSHANIETSQDRENRLLESL